MVIEQGGGISLETDFSWQQRVGWAALTPKIASLTCVCVYDRVAWREISVPTVQQLALALRGRKWMLAIPQKGFALFLQYVFAFA